jgi:hypothetical protein
MLGVGDGSFVQVQMATLAGEAGDIDALDLDGDGDTDPLAGHGDGQRLSLFRGNGGGTLAPKQDVLAQFAPLDVAEGGLDGNGCWTSWPAATSSRACRSCCATARALRRAGHHRPGLQRE